MFELTKHDFPTSQAISPIDGLYRGVTFPLALELSEYGLIRARVQVEVEYLIHFMEQGVDIRFPSFTPDQVNAIRSIHKDFSLADAQRIKDIEVRGVPSTIDTKEIKATNHDVKAVEYFVREKLQQLGLWDYEEFTHIGLTSQDINNTAVPMMIHRTTTDTLWWQLWKFYNTLPLELQRTPLWQELDTEIKKLWNYQPSGKFWGATGGFNALHTAYPDVDWPKFGDSFLQGKLWLHRQQFTTQIEHYDSLMSHFNTYKRIGSILRRFTVLWDIDKKVEREVSVCIGTMTAYIEHFATKLPVSRHQRDLSDSTVTRTFGVPLAYMMITLNKLWQSLWAHLEVQDTQTQLSPLTAIGSVDGRYRQRNTKDLARYFSAGSQEKTPLQSAFMKVLIHDFIQVQESIAQKAQQYKHIPMLAYTHWQAATPTNFWKEFQVFVERIETMKKAVLELPSLETTLDFIVSLNTILLDFSRDIWLYIHLWYLKSKPKEGEVGSSAMPHKVNPIDFENAEGNLWLASALLQYIVRDGIQENMSTVGEAFGYIKIALESLKKWLGKIEVNEQVIWKDLDKNPMVLAEAIQTYFKARWIKGAYEKLRDFTRGEERTLVELHNLIDSMEELSVEDKIALKTSPAEYIGQYPQF
jgi:adenylosuccinate lyase